MSVRQEYIKQLFFQNRVVSWQQSLYVPRKIKRVQPLQKLTLSIMPLNHRLKYINSWCFIVPGGMISGKRGVHCPEAPCRGESSPWFSRPTRQKKGCVSVHGRGQWVPSANTLYQESRAMKAGGRDKGGWGRETWRMGNWSGHSAGHDNKEPFWQVGGCKFVSSFPTCSTLTLSQALSSSWRQNRVVAKSTLLSLFFF